MQQRFTDEHLWRFRPSHRRWLQAWSAEHGYDPHLTIGEAIECLKTCGQQRGIEIDDRRGGWTIWGYTEQELIDTLWQAIDRALCEFDPL